MNRDDTEKMGRDKGINIFKVTYDGWQSVGEIQRLNEKGIRAEELSVDKTTAPYDTTKTLLYTGTIAGYEHFIAIREFKELIKTDKEKIDHPDMSWERYEQERTDKGSKDVSDGIAATAYTCIKEISVDCGICF